MIQISKIFNIKNFKLISKKSFFLLSIFSFVCLWFFIISPYLSFIPDDFKYTADVVSVDNFYDEGEAEYGGEKYSKTKFFYEVVSREKNILFIKNVFDVRSLDGRQVFRADPLYAIDRKTGVHVPGLGEKERSGYLFAPKGLEKGQSFDYWHVSSNVPANMEYVGEEYLYGLKVYKYEKSNIEASDQTEFLGFLPGVPESRGIKLSSRLEMWVEPISGYPVKIEDSSLDYYYYDIKTGEKLHPYNAFSNRYSEESVVEHVSFARAAKSKALFVNFGLIGFLMLVFIFTFLSKFSIYRKIVEFFKDNKMATCIFFIITASSLFPFTLIKDGIRQKALQNFEDHSVEIKKRIKEREVVIENTLLGARGLFDASENVSRAEWKSYIKSLDVFNRYPGPQEVGYSKVVSSSEKDVFIEEIRSEGYLDFTISPQGERGIYTPVIFIEPFNSKNIGTFGFDMFSEHARRRAMVHARDSGKLTSTGKLQLLQEADSGVRYDTIFFLPVYKNGIIPEAVDERIQNVVGYIYAPIIMDDFVKGILRSRTYEIDLHIYSGLGINPNNKIFDLVQEGVSGEASLGDIFFRKVETVYLGGQPFVFEFINLKTYKLDSYNKFLPYVFLAVVFLFNVLIFLVIYLNTEGRKKALRILESTNQYLHKKEEEVRERVRQVEELNKFMVGRELKMIEIKKELDTLKGTKKDKML